MDEIGIFNTFATARIGNALGVIALILYGWLALRYANAVRESGDATIVHKVLGSIFALAGGFAGYNWSIESQNSSAVWRHFAVWMQFIIEIILLIATLRS